MDLKTYFRTGERGTAKKLAEALGISPSYLSQLASGDAPLSPKVCVAIERCTRAAVTRKDLRPHDWRELWPELEDQRPGLAPQPEQAAA